MTALTDERLAEIRRHLEVSSRQLPRRVGFEFLAHIDHLTARLDRRTTQNRRLVALIERLRSEAPPYVNEVVEAQEEHRVSNPRGKQ